MPMATRAPGLRYLGRADNEALAQFPGTSYTDLTNMSVTFAATGLPILVMVNVPGCAASTANTAFTIALREGSTDLRYISAVSATANAVVPIAFNYLATPSAGSKTWKLSMKVASGSGIVFTASQNGATMIVWEVVGA